jgi:methyl-accepting chemotaxis protein
VEAARAGEQGRGFAVVASEVRSLAQRSAQAAKEIKALIGASVEKVAAGTQLVGDAGVTMKDVVAQVKRVAELIDEISTATGEQTAGIGLVSDSVMQIEQVTQQNAALVEQSAAAADSLQQQAARLVDAVRQFKLKDDGLVLAGTA